MKTVSVHIVTFNSRKDIEKCLDSVFIQNHPVSQIIVIDNGSGDGTQEILLKYKEQIMIVFNTSNTGFAPAHNQAIKLSKADYHLVLNPDVTLHPDYIYELIKHAEQGDRVGSLTGKLVFQSSPDTIDSCGLRINKARRGFELGGERPTSEYTSSIEVFGVSGAAALYSREMINDISFQGEFFDETFFAYKEDVDVAWRARLLGWKAAMVPAAQAYHERGWKKGSRSKQSLFIRKFSYINRYKMIFKNDRLKYILKNLPSLFLYELMSLSYILIREPRLLCAWGLMFKDYKRMKLWRAYIRSRTCVDYEEIYCFFKD